MVVCIQTVYAFPIFEGKNQTNMNAFCVSISSAVWNVSLFHIYCITFAAIGLTLRCLTISARFLRSWKNGRQHIASHKFHEHEKKLGVVLKISWVFWKKIIIFNKSSVIILVPVHTYNDIHDMYFWLKEWTLPFLLINKRRWCLFSKQSRKNELHRFESPNGKKWSFVFTVFFQKCLKIK